MSSTGVSSNNIATALIAEIEHEAGVTRTVIERVPAEKFDWKPHEKSMTFGRLASHVAEMFGWTPPTMEQAELDFSKMDYKPFEPKTTEELVEFLDKNVAEAIASLKASPDERFMENWDDAKRRASVFHDAEDRGHAFVRHEPHHSSSRPAFGLSPAQ
jgi:hypothetical protein